MDSTRGLLDENTLQSIAKAAGRGVTEKQVEDVLNAVLSSRPSPAAAAPGRAAWTFCPCCWAGTPPRPPKPRPATPTCPTGRPAAY